MNDSTRHDELPAEGQQEQEPVTQAEGNTPRVDIMYFGIRTRRLILCTILTSGLYETYWLYKQWQAIKKAEKSNIWPFWRTIFGIFFLYDLYSRIYISAKNNNDPKVFPYQDLVSNCLIFFVSYIFSIFIFIPVFVIPSPFLLSGFMIYFSWLCIGGLISSLLFIRMLFYGQKAINCNNAKLNADYKLPDTYTLGEVICIFIGVYISLANIARGFLPR